MAFRLKVRTRVRRVGPAEEETATGPDWTGGAGGGIGADAWVGAGGGVDAVGRLGTVVAEDVSAKGVGAEAVDVEEELPELDATTEGMATTEGGGGGGGRAATTELYEGGGEGRLQEGVTTGLE